ncbi:hypothetical protein ACFL6I_06895 [candidate division KSB1 bacterium]
MTTKTVKLLVFITLLVHGIGHLQGVIGSLGVKLNSSNYVSWLLKGLGETPNRNICLLLYLITAVMGILTALSFYSNLISYSSWPILALITAFTSTACLVLFPNALAMFFNKAGAVVVNLIIFYSILFNGNWPAAIFEE